MILCFRIQGKPRASTIPVIEIWDIYIFIITFGSCCCHTLVISYQSNPVDSPEIGWKCARLRGQILCICWCIYQTEPSNIVHSFEPSKFSPQSYSTGAACAAPALASDWDCTLILEQSLLRFLHWQAKHVNSYGQGIEMAQESQVHL
jgi:hypothetical protein